MCTSEETGTESMIIHRGRRYLCILTIISLVAITGAGCAIEQLRERPHPFLHYTLSLQDHDLNVIRVTGRVLGSIRKKVVLRRLCLSGESVLEPIGFTAKDMRGKELSFQRNENAFIIDTGRADFTFTYTVVLTVTDRYSPNIRTMLTFIDRDRYRILGRDVLIVPELNVSDGIILDIDLNAAGDIHAAWPSIGNRTIVPTLENLPLTLAVAGNYRHTNATVGGTELSLAITGDWSFEDEEFFEVICKIVSREMAMFGSSPHHRYLFVCDRNPVKGYGGFQYYGIHFSGSMILLLDQHIDASELFDTPMSIIAHEFFHNWNGEALKPVTDDFLWFTEGVTVYYSYRVLVDVNVITQKQYDDHRRALRKRYLENPYLDSVSIGKAANNDLHDKAMVNLLYDGGFLAAEALDEYLAALSRGRVRLIDVLKTMYERDGGRKRINEETLLQTIKGTFGYDLSPFLKALIHTPASQILADGLLSS